MRRPCSTGGCRAKNKQTKAILNSEVKLSSCVKIVKQNCIRIKYTTQKTAAAL
jgi:hypothetical protein